MSKDLTIEWDGKTHTIKEDQLFELIEAIERDITLPELLSMVGQGKPNFSAIARPLHVMLTFAGVRNVPSMLELRRDLVQEGFESLIAQTKGDQPKSQTGMVAIGTMIELLMDGAEVQEAEPEQKKTKPRSRKAATKSRSGSGA